MTWVYTLVVAFHEFASHSLQMRLFPGVGGAFAHVNCVLALNWILVFGVIGQSFFVNASRPTAGNPKLTGEVALDSFSCYYEIHPVARGDESSITAVEQPTSEVGRISESQSAQGSREALGSIRARSRALRSIILNCGLECSSSDEDFMSRARRESCADLRKYRYNFWIPRNGN